MSRRKRIYGKRRKRSALKSNHIDCSDRLTELKNKKYCDNLEYQRRKNRYDKKGYKTNAELQENKKYSNITFNPEDFKVGVVTGTPPVSASRVFRVANLLGMGGIDVKKELSNAWNQWSSGGKFRGRGND